MSSREQVSDGRSKILFRFEVDEQVGLGHLCRCRAIAIEFAEHADVEIVLSSLREDLVQSAFGGVGYKLVSPGDIFGEALFDVAVVDVPDFSWQAQQSLNSVCKLFIGIDDSGAGPFVYDVLIRPNVLPLPAAQMSKVGAEIWAGKDYIVLHPAFAKLKPKSDKWKKAKDILVCFGGSDPAGLTLRVIPVLRQLPVDIRINVVIGQGFLQPEKAVDLIGGDRRFRVLLNISDLAGMFNICGAALVAGGTLMYEACSLGVPSIVVCQNEEQKQEAAIFAGQHALLNLGSAADVSDNIIINAVEKVCCDIDLRKELSRNAKEMVPRAGVQRVTTMILGKLGRTVG
jgi:spore coat polysaccharide biosynthesis predicted glycosyltransferase SpsG